MGDGGAAASGGVLGGPLLILMDHWTQCLERSPGFPTAQDALVLTPTAGDAGPGRPPGSVERAPPHRRRLKGERTSGTRSRLGDPLWGREKD
ncbi:hypothetical protein NDU88_003938 [Pleurodeles waltl]|uniref:Uncharacterized protein n=1 Tax=Pleurodeles waltl TaxID=8319 RepID=A0AAV7T724_PLEWA|nr:hypothetical protein NDU88_003938 [Pleurodeles waltl]